MAALLGVLFAAAAADGADVEALQRLWSGVRDSSEQVVMSAEHRAGAWPLLSEQRVRTIVAPVSVAWLGVHVLYLEEFLEDDPEDPRRQLLLALEPAGTPAPLDASQLPPAADGETRVARPGCLPGL